MSERIALWIASIRILCFAEYAPICATRLATLAKIVAFMHAPISTTSDEKKYSPCVVSPSMLSPITIISAV